VDSPLVQRPTHRTSLCRVEQIHGAYQNLEWIACKRFFAVARKSQTYASPAHLEWRVEQVPIRFERLNGLPWWEKLTMDVSLWVRFTATERRERGAAQWVVIEPSLDDPCTALCIIDRAPKPRAADGTLSAVS
jgi:hypothetical protein